MSCASASRKVDFLRAHCAATGKHFFSYDPEGLGTAPVKDFSLLRFAHWEEDARLALDCARAQLGSQGHVTVVGSSMGGTVALRLASARPEAVAKLLLVCPSLGMSGAAAAWNRELRGKSDEEKRRIVEQGNRLMNRVIRTN